MNDKELNLIPNVHIETGNADIIASGTVITFNNEADCKIHFSFNDGFYYTICFSFQDDNDLKETRLRKVTSINEPITTIFCINFNDLVGTSMSEPTYIITYKGRSIFLNFWIMASAKKNIREIRYCLYLDKDITL